MSDDYESALRGEMFAEVLPKFRNQSEIVVLDFTQIPPGIPDYKNMRSFFEQSRAVSVDPKLPASRQAFNDEFLERAGKRYLIGRYGEDRIEMLRGSHIAEEGRTLHLAVDIFCRNLETVYVPADGAVVKADREPGNHSYGNYIIVEHVTKGTRWYSFFGHLSCRLPSLGPVRKGATIATLGDFIDNENGGWSRHLHYQILRELPPPGETPIGYSRKEDFETNSRRFPDPRIVLGDIVSVGGAGNG